jgi:hypothetical protein
MSADRYSLYWCLGQTGWATIQQPDTPEGWVRIYEEEVYQGSPFGRESRHWHLLKTNGVWSGASADLLEAKFPRPEPRRTLSPEALKALER